MPVIPTKDSEKANYTIQSGVNMGNDNVALKNLYQISSHQFKIIPNEKIHTHSNNPFIVLHYKVIYSSSYEIKINAGYLEFHNGHRYR